MLSLQCSLVWYFLASFKGAKKVEAGVLSGSITEEIWHTLGHFSRSAPTYLICVPFLQSLPDPLELQQMKQGSCGQQPALQPWLILGTILAYPWLVCQVQGAVRKEQIIKDIV